MLETKCLPDMGLTWKLERFLAITRKLALALPEAVAEPSCSAALAKLRLSPSVRHYPEKMDSGTDAGVELSL